MDFSSVLKNLSSTVDSNLIKSREGWRDRNGDPHMVQYVEWHTVADILDKYAPSWSYSVVNIFEIGETVCVIASITIDGVTREGIGTSSRNDETGIKKCEHDALKRAAVKFGVARFLYKHEFEDDTYSEESSLSKESIIQSPISQKLLQQVSIKDPITSKQVSMIETASTRSGVDANELSMKKFKKPINDLTKKEASGLITELLRQFT